MRGCSSFVGGSILGAQRRCSKQYFSAVYGSFASLKLSALVTLSTAIAIVPSVKAESAHQVYLDILGRLGAYGVGYEFNLKAPWHVGLSASLSVMDGERLTAASPYVGRFIVQSDRHGWFAQTGLILAQRRVGSPVPEWDGASQSGVAWQISSGYQFNLEHLFLRAYAVVSVGRGGWSPWLGLTIGTSL